MKGIYLKIWNLALPMQDLRDDSGHAKVVTQYATELCTLLKADERVVIPAAILHDIGYYGMDKKVLTALMSGKLPEEEVKRIKEQHMVNGAEFSEQILRKVNYDLTLIPRIVKIVRNHDYSTPSESVEETAVRDADKLWRYSKPGFSTDIKRRSIPPIEWHAHMEKNLSKPNYFLSDIALQIARRELENRIREIK